MTASQLCQLKNILCMEVVATLLLLHKTEVCIHLAACSRAFLFGVYLCFHAHRHEERRGVEQFGASGNSIFPASPLCLNSWAQSGSDGFFLKALSRSLRIYHLNGKDFPMHHTTLSTGVFTFFIANTHNEHMMSFFLLPDRYFFVLERYGSSVKHLAMGRIQILFFLKTTHAK